MSPVSPKLFESDEREVHFEPVEAPQPIADLPDTPPPPPPAAAAPAQALVADAANELERNLQLVGATAIEDQLQDNVPDTIAYLREAGVKVRAQPTARAAAEGCAKTGLTRVRCVCVCRCGC